MRAGISAEMKSGAAGVLYLAVDPTRGRLRPKIGWREMNEEQIDRNVSGIPRLASTRGLDEGIPGSLLLQRLPQLDLTDPRPKSHFVQPHPNMEPKGVGMNRNPTNGEDERTVNPRDNLSSTTRVR